MKKKPINISPQEAARILKEETVITVDNPPQEKPLRLVKHVFYGFREAPSDIDMNTPAGVVFYNLCVCYMNTGNVSEGAIGDVIWGFRQSGIPNNITFDGFKDLIKKGYMTLSDHAGNHVFGEAKDDLYYKWTNKFFKLLAQTPEEAKPSEPSHELKKANVEGLK